MIKQAAEFAEQAHKGAFRKGTSIPYLTHPLETAVIVSMLTTDPELIAAALLHDTLEDTETTYEDLKSRFGVRVADLVAEESEDKRKSWQERKGYTIAHLAHASREIKILTLADKLSNIRSMARDYLLKGEELWQRFRVKEKSMHAWYYLSVKEQLMELSDTPQFKEYEELCRRVFGEALTETDTNAEAKWVEAAGRDKIGA